MSSTKWVTLLARVQSLDCSVVATHYRRGWDMGKIPNNSDFELVVPIAPQFSAYADAAMLRIQMLYPGCQLAIADGAIVARLSADHSEDHLRKAILHAVYREKIYTETLSMRRALVSAVTG